MGRVYEVSNITTANLTAGRTLLYLAFPTARLNFCHEWGIMVTDNATAFMLEARLQMRTTSASPGAESGTTKVVRRDEGDSAHSFTVVGAPASEPSYDASRFLTPRAGLSTLGLEWRAKSPEDRLLLEGGTEWGLTVMTSSFSATDFLSWMVIEECG